MKLNKLKLALAMDNKGYNFKLLSKNCGVSRTTLSYLNNGKTCKPEILFKIAKALDVKAEELIEQ